MRPGPCSGAHEARAHDTLTLSPRPARTRTRARARSRRSAAGGVAGERLERDDDLGGQDDRPEEDEDQTRATWEMDRTEATGTATVAMTATAADRMAVNPMITAKATTVWRRWQPRMTQPAIQGTGGRGPTGGRLAGQASRCQAGPGAHHLKTSAARSCWSCWSRQKLAVEARAPVTDVVKVTYIPVGGHAVAVKRAVRVRWCAEAEGSGRCASGVGGAQRAGQRRTSGPCVFEARTRDRLNVRVLHPMGRIRLI